MRIPASTSVSSAKIVTKTRTRKTKLTRSLFPVSFNLNYFRPHVFSLEAEPELAAFVESFDL